MLRKCPRCELNYIEETEKFCKVCRREMKGEEPRDEVEMCTICNENPVLPGKDVCHFCLKEMNEQQGRPMEDETVTISDPNLEIDPISSMDEIIPDIQEDINNKEFGEMESSLSLEAMGEDEEDEDEDEEDEEN